MIPKPANIVNKSKNGMYANDNVINILLKRDLGFTEYLDKILFKFI